MDRAKAISVAQATLKTFKGFGLSSPYLSHKNDIWTWKAHGWKVVMNWDETVIQAIDEWQFTSQES